jgi:predicted RecA/RadA family phage recombinase
MKNFISEGKTIDLTVKDNPVKGGDIIIVGAIAAVAVTDGKVGDVIAAKVEGVFELPAGNGALAQGVKAYLNVAETGERTIVGTATGNTLVGYVWEASEAAAPTVLVKINA